MTLLKYIGATMMEPQLGGRIVLHGGTLNVPKKLVEKLLATKRYERVSVEKPKLEKQENKKDKPGLPAPVQNVTKGDGK